MILLLEIETSFRYLHATEEKNFMVQQKDRDLWLDVIDW